MAPTPQYLSASARAEVLAQAQRLVLVGRAEPHPVYPRGTAAQPLEPHLERDLPVVDQEGHLARSYLHNNLGAKHAPVAEAEARIEEARVMRANLARPRVVDHHLGGVVGWYTDALFGHEDVEPVGFEDVAVAPRALDGLPELRGVVVPDR